jgi:hypothetical protein
VHQTPSAAIAVKSFYRFILWDDGVSDIPELMALEPKDAMQVVIDAKQAQMAADFGKPMRWKDLSEIAYVLAVFVLMIAASVSLGYPILVVLAGGSLLGFLIARGRREYAIGLRPYIHTALKARQTRPRTR